MKQIKNLLILFSLVIITSVTYGQNADKAINLGTISSFKKSLTQDVATNGLSTKSTKSISQQIPGKENLSLEINFQNDEQDALTLVGSVSGIENSTFYLSLSESEVRGHIILKNEKIAFEYFANDDGDVFISEKDIDKVLCIEFPEAPAELKTKSADPQLAIAEGAYDLQSQSGAEACILLDFDGHSLQAGTGWFDGNTWWAPASGMSDAAIQEAWEIVSEDYRPYNVNVTTSQSVFDSYPVSRRVRCVFTPDNAPAPGAGGVAFVGSFGYNDWPCWVFMMSSKAGAEAASHEIGHTLGLGHDGRTNPQEEYFLGHGDWAPIMGAGYYVNISQWSRGEYNYANNGQDDLAIINQYIQYKNDDYGNDFGSANTIAKDGNGNVEMKYGIIHHSADLDMFTFTCGTGNVSLNVNTVSRHGDLDILVRLYEGSTGNQIGTFNDGGLNCAVNASLGAGTYYLAVDGTGAGNVGTDGYSDYGSLGSYWISGTIPPGGGDVQNTTGEIVFYKDCSFGGTAVGLPVGDYNLAALQANGILNDDVSSIKVKNGYRVELFWDDNFTGSSITFTSDDDCLVNEGWNDKATSLRIRPNGVGGLNGTYTIVNRNSNLVMDVANGDVADGTNILQWNSTGNANQQFTFNDLGDGMYTITNVQTGKVLDIDAISQDNFANLHQWTYAGSNNQKFIVQSTDNGYYKLIAGHSGKILEVGYASTALNANINQYSDNNQLCGQWKLNPVVTSSWSSVIEAENYANMSGIDVEACSEGGQNIGWIDAGDWIVWDVDLPATATYTVEYRVASANGGGTIQLEKAGGAPVYGNIGVPSTGGWQNWTTISHSANLDAGQQQLAIYVPAGGYNLNWIKITQAAQGIQSQSFAVAQDDLQNSNVNVYPNPVNDILNIDLENSAFNNIQIVDYAGKVIVSKDIDKSISNLSVPMSGLKQGVYILRLSNNNSIKAIKLFKN